MSQWNHFPGNLYDFFTTAKESRQYLSRWCRPQGRCRGGVSCMAVAMVVWTLGF